MRYVVAVVLVFLCLDFDESGFQLLHTRYTNVYTNVSLSLFARPYASGVVSISPQPDACAMAAGDEKNPLNQMKLQERQNPSVGQSEPLPTERKASTIPMADFHPAHQDETAKVGRASPSQKESTQNSRTDGG